jgi:transposase
MMKYGASIKGRLCIDEKDIQGQVYTILSNSETSHIVGLVPETKASAVVKFFKENISAEERATVREISADMSPTIEKIIADLFPNAIVVTDRFHVMKNLLGDI